jgi:hypothetical protein
VPVYFAQDSEDLDYLVDSLQGLGNEKSASAAQGTSVNFEKVFLPKINDLSNTLPVPSNA